MRLAFWRKPPLSEEHRHALEEWVRLRLHSLDRDPMIAMIGAIARLRDEGMGLDEAVELVTGIVRNQQPPRP